MKLTPKQKIYFTALGLAAGAFAVDRLFFSPPTASARPAALTHHPALKKPAAAPKTASDELIDMSAISDRLKSAAAKSGTTDINDAFRPSPAWIERANASGRGTLATAVDQFRNQHHLLAVMSGDRSGWIIVDGKTLGIGQSLGEFRLVEVRERAAVFQLQDIHVELQLSK